MKPGRIIIREIIITAKTESREDNVMIFYHKKVSPKSAVLVVNLVVPHIQECKGQSVFHCLCNLFVFPLFL